MGGSTGNCPFDECCYYDLVNNHNKVPTTTWSRLAEHLFETTLGCSKNPPVRRLHLLALMWLQIRRTTWDNFCTAVGTNHACALTFALLICDIPECFLPSGTKLIDVSFLLGGHIQVRQAFVHMTHTVRQQHVFCDNFGLVCDLFN